jgi:hypothetical protein
MAGLMQPANHSPTVLKGYLQQFESHASGRHLKVIGGRSASVATAINSLPTSYSWPPFCQRGRLVH